MHIRVNGIEQALEEANLAVLLARHAIDPEKPGVAVAVNEEIVPRSTWATVVLKGGDAVEIVRPHSGG